MNGNLMVINVFYINSIERREVSRLKEFAEKS